MLKAFSLSNEGFYRLKLGIIGDYDDVLIDDFINQTIPFEYNVDFRYSYLTDGFMGLRFLITLRGIVDYKKNYPTLISYSGDYNLIKNTNSIPLLNKINKDTCDLNPFCIENIQNEFNKIIIYKNNTWKIKITHLKSDKETWRMYSIPENTTINQLEEMILISFDANPDSFNLNQKLIKDVFKAKSKIYSEKNEFSIEYIKKCYSTKDYPLLENFEGGLNPFDMWFEYYPKDFDKHQSSLDAFI
ncbi:MAG: hypothetical protein K6A34_02595 [Methanobrevibacter sp.]|nr:hypothetical protein [Methanobrevibacter sp.]